MNFLKKNHSLSASGVKHKKTNRFLASKKLVVLVMAVVITTMSSCSDDDPTIDEQTKILTQQEEDDLIFSREEEKLARDVYLFSYDKYGEALFNNIAQSEQMHMDLILTSLNLYNLSDPASSERGVFSDQILQNIYNDLISLSDLSLVEAYKVGAFIEDLDINDLDILESHTTRTDLLNVYNKLECGSRNHMRVFYGQLVLNGINYVPQYISLEHYTEIITSDFEQCN